MRAVIRSIQCADIADLDNYVSNDPENDGVWIRLIVGPADGPGEESFDVLVCTPLWMRAVVREQGPQIGRHRLIVDPFNIEEAIEFLRRRIETIDAPSWIALGEKIGRLGHWEFEDYDVIDQ